MKRQNPVPLVRRQGLRLHGMRSASCRNARSLGTAAGRGTWRMLLAVALLAAATCAALALAALHRPIFSGAAPIAVRIGSGASTRAIAQRFAAAGADVNPTWFVIAAAASGSTRHLRAGRYLLDPGMSLAALLERLRHGDVLRERLTVVEGWTVRDLRARLDADPDLRHDSATLSEGDLLRAIGATEARAEGLFAPDTYVFDPGSSDLELLRRAYRSQVDRLREAWDRRPANLPYRDPYEALIMASLVEKETGRPEERGRIAGVLVNRQRRGMMLQTDPAVVYGLGDRYDGSLHRRDLMTDTPFNTYTRAGLPPTPIALPGRAAIDAALGPDPTVALYFVARGDGTTQFSDTLAQHNRAVDLFQRGASH